jgi:hypothetical protein
MPCCSCQGAAHSFAACQCSRTCWSLTHFKPCPPGSLSVPVPSEA